MEQKFIIGDIVKYDNKIMIIKEPRDGSHFDLSCPKEGLVYCLVDVDEIKPMEITPKILKKNGWERNGGDSYLKYSLYRVFFDVCHVYTLKHYEGSTSKYFDFISKDSNCCYKSNIMYCHQLQHLLFGLGLPMDLKV